MQSSLRSPYQVSASLLSYGNSLFFYHTLWGSPKRSQPFIRTPKAFRSVWTSSRTTQSSAFITRPTMSTPRTPLAKRHKTPTPQRPAQNASSPFDQLRRHGDVVKRATGGLPPVVLVESILPFLNVLGRLRLSMCCRQTKMLNPFAPSLERTVDCLSDSLSIGAGNSTWHGNIDALLSAIARAIIGTRNPVHVLKLVSVHLKQRHVFALAITLGGRPLLPTNLKSLCLRNCTVTAEGADAVAHGLPPSLTELDLCQNNIGNAGATSIASRLRSHTALTNVQLCGNSIGDEGAIAVSDAIALGTPVKILGLQSNSIGFIGAQSLANMLLQSMIHAAIKHNTSLTSLNFFNNHLRNDAAENLVAAAKQQGKIKTLCGIKSGEKVVNLSWNDDSESRRLGAPDAILLSFDLEFNRALTSVNLLRNNLGGGAVAIVAAAKQNGNIKTLCGIEEGKTEVDLHCTHCGQELKEPDAVLLSFDLVFNRALKSANLGFNSIGDGGTTALSDVLKSNSTLETLELLFNKIGASGAQSLADMLQVNRALTSVNLLQNNLGGGATAVVTAAKQNGNIKTLCGIEEGKTEVTFFGLEAPDAVLLSFDLEFNRALNTLNLSDNNIGGVSGYVKKDKLQGTSFKKGDTVQYNGQQCIVFKEEDSYGELRVQNMSGVSALAEALKFNRALISANLDYNNIGDEGAIAISAALETNTTLGHLSLKQYSDGTKITAVGAQAIAKMLVVNRGLTSVNLLRNDLGDVAAAVVAAAKQNGNIKTLCGINEGETEVDLSEKDLEVADAVLLSFDLEFNRSLKSARLGNNFIGDKGTAALSEALKSNSTLGELELPGNEIGAAGAQSLANMLQFNRALKSANLAENEIGDEGAVAISAALEVNNTLTALNLRVKWKGVQISATGAQAIAKMLAVNRALKSVDFSANSIGDEGTAVLSDALKTNSTLETLELRDNEVGVAGAQSLAGMLQVNRALTSVNVLQNNIGDGAAAIVAAAKQQGNIKTLCGIKEGQSEFKHNGYEKGYRVSASDVVLLSFDLEFNRALTSVNLLQNDLGDGASAIVAAAKQQGKIKTLCGIKEGQSEFMHYGPGNGFLKASDAVLLSFDLEFNRSLISANLDYNDIGDEGAIAISAALESNTTLEHLSLKTYYNRTKITAVGAQAIAKMLVVNRALKSVDLRGNSILDEGCRQLRAAVGNKSITLHLEPQRRKR